jgi:hypothetical protein
MLTSECYCGQPKNPNATECMTCANETRRQKLKGVRHSEQRSANIRAARQRQQAEGHKNFDLAAYMRGKPHPFAVPVGTERIVKDGRVVVKREDGKWRYRSRIVWAEANGPIPRRMLIHHRNENPMDDRLENLQMVTRSEHMKIHSTPDRMRDQQRLTVEARKKNGTY